MGNKEFFTVSQIHRDDLAQVIGLKAYAYTDSDMQLLADKMNDDYLNQLYWESMRIIAEFLIEDGSVTIVPNNTNKASSKEKSNE